jgi:hypothetical protein
MYAFIPTAGVTGFGAYPNYILAKMFVKTTCKILREKGIKKKK